MSTLAGPPNGPIRTLRHSNFVPLALRGWGDPWNAYIHAMTMFQGHLYCGTFRANLCWKKRQKDAPLRWPVWPIKCPEGEAIYTDLDIRAHMWRYSFQEDRWENVYQSPYIKGRSGFDVPRECSYRGFATFKGKSDSEPALYISTFSNNQCPGPQILRSENGLEYTAVSKPGLGFEGVSSFRTLVSFKGWLFATLIGSTKNVAVYSPYPVVFATDDPLSDNWVAVSEHGFGNPDNHVIFEMEVFNDHLYAATFNHKTGFELWRTDAEGSPPFHWSCVMRDGAGRGSLNEGLGCMAVFKGALYLGTCIQDGGYDRVNKIGPAGGEIIRVYPDNSWDIVVGRSRLVGNQLQSAKSGYRPGFNDLFNGYIWRMCVHDGALYAGTANTRIFLRYSNQDEWPDRAREIVEAMGVENMIAENAGFDLWGTGNGDDWHACTINGFGNPYNVGVRGLVSTPGGLAVGVVNHFGPQRAVIRDGEWVYEDNPRGGAEVWLGAQILPPEIRDEPPMGAYDPTLPASAYTPQEDQQKLRVSLTHAQAGNDREFVYSKKSLRRLSAGADPSAVLHETINRAHEYFDFTAIGLERVPDGRPIVFAGNNPAVPFLTTPEDVSFLVDWLALWCMPMHALLTQRLIVEHRGHAPRIMVSLRYYEVPEVRRLLSGAFASLGCVPATAENGRKLLELGESLLVYPEDRPSQPPYQTVSFNDDFVRMAWKADALIVPVAFLGPHESRLIIESNDEQIIINPHSLLSTRHTAIFLPPILPRNHITNLRHQSQIRKLAEDTRTKIQTVLDQQCTERPLVQLAKRFQERFGTMDETVEPIDFGL